MKKLVGFVALAAVAVACSSIAPVPIKAGEICYRCRSVISEPKQAAELITTGGLVTPFKSPDCVAKYLVEHPSDKSTVFISDFETGKMVAPDSLLFVHVVNRDNGKEDFQAYVSEKSAAAAAATNKVTPVKWAAVLEHAKAD